MDRDVLLIDDDRFSHKWLQTALASQGFDLHTAESAKEGIDFMSRHKPDFILLDGQLPDGNGFDLCRTLRQSKDSAHIPLMMLSACQETRLKVRALDMGADDYLTKPFEMRELIARMRTILRPCQGPQPEEILRREGIMLNVTQYTAEVCGKELKLTAMEFKLLHLFMKNPGRVLTRPMLMAHGWGMDVNVPTRTLDVHILRLRHKMGRKHSSAIKTMHGLGYRFN